ncbi:hypothetical protein, partial [Pseudomonas sp. SDO55104_S430]
RGQASLPQTSGSQKFQLSGGQKKAAHKGRREKHAVYAVSIAAARLQIHYGQIFSKPAAQ